MRAPRLSDSVPDATSTPVAGFPFSPKTTPRTSRTAPSTDFCSLHRGADVDDCLPGGRYDPLSGKCSGQLGARCYQCFEGSLCEKQSPLEKCTLQSGGGLPTIFLDYWQAKNLEGQPCIAVPNDLVANYQFGGTAQKPSLLIIPALDAALRELHAAVGNAESGDEYFLIPAAGSTQAMAAAMFAMGAMHGTGGGQHVPVCDGGSCLLGAGGKVKAFSQRPYYSHYAYQANVTARPDRGQIMLWAADEVLFRMVVVGFRGLWFIMTVMVVLSVEEKM